MSTEKLWISFDKTNEAEKAQSQINSTIEGTKWKTLNVLAYNEKNEIKNETQEKLRPVTDQTHLNLEVAINNELNWWNKEKENRLKEDFTPILSMTDVLAAWESMWEEELLVA